MLARFAAVWLAVAASVLSALGDQGVVPASKLRPIDPAHFHPGLVKLLDTDVEEIVALLGQGSHRSGRSTDLDRLRAEAIDAPQSIRLLGASSQAVREWTMRKMGEHSADYSSAAPKLLSIAVDSSEREFNRALAARVIARSAMDVATVSKLTRELGGASKELRVIFLETIGASGAAGKVALPELARHLAESDASAQFHTFRAVRRIEEALGEDIIVGNGESYAAARSLSKLQKSRPADGAEASVAILQKGESPAYVKCLVLLGLAGQKKSEAVPLVVEAIADRDEFVSELAGNVLDSLPEIDGAGVAALASGIQSTNAYVRLRCLVRLRERGVNANEATTAVVAALQRAAQEGAAREVGVCSDVLRKLGTNAASASDVLAQLLEEGSPIYRGMTKHDVDRLRGFLFATLAETGVPASALSTIVSALANADAWSAHEFAGAARAAGSAQAREASGYLLRALRREIDDDLVAFDRFDVHTGRSRGYTTAQIEALKALSRIGGNDERSRNAVQAFLNMPPRRLDSADRAQGIPDVRTEASKALTAMQQETK